MKENISTTRRLEYAQGYLALGLVAEAAAELDAIDEEVQRSDEVADTRVAVLMATAQWSAAASLAKELTQRRPDRVESWISWAFATRRAESIADAECILLEADKRFGPVCAIVQYNLACYRCQLGDLVGARERLALACREDAGWKRAALADADLEPLWPELARPVSPG